MDPIEKRVEELEVKCSYQDQLIADLDSVVQELNRELQDVRRELKEVRAQVQAGAAGGDNKLEDEVPPHY